MDVNDHGNELRSRVIGMLRAGLTMKKVSERINVSLRSVQIWSHRDKLGQTLGTLARSGRPKSSPESQKSSFRRLWAKEGKSTRLIARNLVNSGYSASHSTVY